MKKLLENKMTRIFLIATLGILLVIIVIVIVAGSSSGVVNENVLSNAARTYYANYPSLLPKENYETNKVSAYQLISTGYLPQNININGCNAFVYVTNVNGEYSYSPVVNCGTTLNTSLSNKLKTNVVTSGNGLYNTNNGYIFRGGNPNNYVRFADSLWRVIGFDENGNIKMIYDDLMYADLYSVWDNRYNESCNTIIGGNNQCGINTFSVSKLHDFLNNILSTDTLKIKFTGPRLARMAKHSMCLGKANTETGKASVCSSIVENVWVSTISANDYISASLDKNCDIGNSIYCQNDNFLNFDGIWTTTADSRNTYQAYYIDTNQGGLISSIHCGMNRAVRPVISIKKDVTYLTGNGTKDNPYQIN